METFQWGVHFETGIEKIDEQHHHLVDIINKYGSALSKQTIDARFMSTIFTELAEYATKHFNDEIKLMEALHIDPRHVNVHKKSHGAFIQDVIRMQQGIDPSKPADFQSLLDYLVHWLAYHILGSDQNLTRQIGLIEDGLSPMDAYEAEEKSADSSTEPLLVALKGLFNLLSEHNRKLTELNNTLEIKVQQRTEELVQANDDLQTLSLTDVLTNLPNRRYAMQQLALLWEEVVLPGNSLGCLMVDADGFKIINDTYGHDAGDVVLIRLAQELHDSVRNDDIVCRLGGDEFLIICPNTDFEGALHLAEHVRKSISELKVHVGDGHWQGSVSIGVAITTDNIKNFDDLIKAADRGVYAAKDAGRNCVGHI